MEERRYLQGHWHLMQPMLRAGDEGHRDFMLLGKREEGAHERVANNLDQNIFVQATGAGMSPLTLKGSPYGVSEV
jgi:hypothetical protein